ncbi:hypothetical protein C8Q77DRAFT_1091615 [Trametes polyzona]|nr:hypothetical protein C8Q77DRAFT_1091615 [Trametes polyzona]
MDQTPSYPPVYAQFKDGTGIEEQSITPSVLAHLHAKSGLLSTLWILTYVRPQLDTLLPLLSKRLPSLEDLRITLVHPKLHGTVCLSVPIVDLKGSFFPSLKVLRFDGVGAKMSTPFLPALRELCLSDYPAVEGIVELPQLMRAVASCRYLETLHLRQYGSSLLIPGEGDWTPPRVGALKSLKNIILWDEPVCLRRFLRIWQVPATANIAVVSSESLPADPAFGETFRKVLSLEGTYSVPFWLPNLKVLKAVEVSTRELTYRVAAETLQGNKLVFEQQTTSDSEPDIAYASTVAHVLPLFRHSPTRLAIFRGNLSRMGMNTEWRKVLEAFPELTEIRVEDTGTVYLGLQGLFKLLGSTSDAGTPGPQVGSRIVSLGVHARRHGLQMLNDIVMCLDSRAKAGLPKLHTLKVEFGADMVGQHRAELQARERQLNALVEVCVLRLLTVNL